MKSGYWAIMCNGTVHGASEMNHCQLHQRLVLTQRRWWCVYGRIGESPLL